MRLAYVLPTVFGLGAAGLGGQLLWRASGLDEGDAGRTSMYVKGAALCLVGVVMLGLLIWKAGRFRR